MVPSTLSREETLPRPPMGLAYSDLPAISPSPSSSPEVLVRQSASGRPMPTPLPSPTPVPPPLPQWVQTARDCSLWRGPEPDAPARLMLPKGSYLKVLDRSGGRMQVYYGGDGDERRPAEGWVEGADVAVAQAPRWVMARSGAALRSGVGPGAQLSAWLLGKTVLQVLEDRGPQLRVFSLGDGAAREAEEGWVAASDLAPAGAMLAAESRGVKMLGQPEVAALRAGDGLWLTVPYRSQLDGSPAASANCGPASVGMALQSQGVMASTEELRALANKLQGTSGPDNGFSIEYLWGVVERYGLKGYDLYGGAGLRRWSLDGLRQHLSQGHPVIPQLRFRLIPGREQSDYYEDHYVVISGMHGDDFIYNDAVDTDGPGYARLMSEATLARAWGQSFFPFAAFAVGKP